MGDPIVFHPMNNLYKKFGQTIFSTSLKGKGFCFESTRITEQARIESMVSVLAIAFAWAHKVGDWRHEKQKPIKIKKHGRLSISYFRYGLDWIQQALLAGQNRLAQLDQSVSILMASLAQFVIRPKASGELLC